MRTRLTAVAAVVALLLTGCSSAPPSSSATSSTPGRPPSASVPASPSATLVGKTLRDLGAKNGPERLLLPADIRVTRLIDQDNVVTLFFLEPPRETTMAFLRQSIPVAGMTITSDPGLAIFFDGAGWNGSYGIGADGIQMLTLRAAG